MVPSTPHDRPPPPASEQPPWPPIQALESSGPPPDRRRPLRPRQIVVAVLAALGIGALLSSGALVGLAERQPLGTQRDVALGAANVADRLAHGLSLNRPAERLAEALDGEEQVYDVEALIARARATTPTTTEPPQPPPAAGDPEVDEPAPPPTEPPPPAEPAPPPAGAEGSAAGELAEAPEVDPDAGPPPDGLITPVEGLDCVPEDATAPTTTTVGGIDDPVACPPGYVLADPGEPATDGDEPGPGAEADGEIPEPVEVTFEAPRVPGEEDALDMYVGGDSISRDLGEGLARITPANLVTIDLDPRPATGLSRPDFFDWAQHLAGVLTESRPDVIVVLFGANDFQNVEHEGRILDRFGDEWLDLYRERVDRIMILLSQPDTQTIWVGQPPVREPRLSGGLERLNTVYDEVAGRHPQVTYLDTWALFSDDGGGYVDEIDGVRLRREDGVHLTVDGGNRLAEAVWAMIAPAWGLG